MKDRQLNIRLDEALAKDFDHACEANHTNKTEAITRLIVAYVAAFKESKTMHLDGTLCPLSRFVADIASSVRTIARTDFNQK